MDAVSPAESLTEILAEADGPMMQEDMEKRAGLPPGGAREALLALLVAGEVWGTLDGYELAR